MKTSELTGPALDWAVAKCEGAIAPLGNVMLIGKQLFIGVGSDPYYENKIVIYAPSTDWSQGGPIVEREIDQISRYETYPDYRADRFATDDYEDCHAIGPTMLIAAMRCFVASKLGDEVEIPEELL